MNMVIQPPERLAGQAHYEKSQDMVVVKLRTTSDSERRPAVAPRGRAPLTSSEQVLASLVDSGRVKRVTSVFGSDPDLSRSGRSPAVVRPERPTSDRLQRSRGLLTLELDSGTDAEVLAMQLRDQGGIEYAYAPAIKYPLASPAALPNDPLYHRQWNHAQVRIPQARARSSFRDCSDVVIAVVDTGIERSHPDLAGSIESYTNYLSNDEGDDDYEGHGTHVSGIISAVTNNQVGIAGLCGAKIQAIKGLPRKGGKWRADRYYLALAHAIDHGARVLNLSLGGDADPGERDIIEDLLAAGIVVVAAMGNEFQRGNFTCYPAAYEGVIAVAATDRMDARASFSNTGAHVALGAPGVGILSTVPAGGGSWSDAYDAWDGTSMATPHVAAAAALVLAANGGLSPAEVRDRLVRSAAPVGDTSDALGAGRLDIERLVTIT